MGVLMTICVLLKQDFHLGCAWMGIDRLCRIDITTLFSLFSFSVTRFVDLGLLVAVLFGRVQVTRLYSLYIHGSGML